MTIDRDWQSTEIDNWLRLTFDRDWQATKIDNKPRLTINRGLPATEIDNQQDCQATKIDIDTLRRPILNWNL